MNQLTRQTAAYFGTPLIGKRRLGDFAATFAIAAGSVIAAILLVHAFAPPGLTARDLILHVLTLTVSFALGLALVGGAIITIIRRRGATFTVAHLWIISAAGFALGLVISGVAEDLRPLAQAAGKASSVHGSGSMLLRLLPVWALITGFVARAEILRTYKAWLGDFDRGDGADASLPGWYDTVTIESGANNFSFRHADIICANAEENYTQLVVREKDDTQQLLVRATFKSILRLLPGDVFLQIHRSHIVNRGHIKSVGRRGRHFHVLMAHDVGEFRISRRRVRDVMAEIDRQMKT